MVIHCVALDWVLITKMSKSSESIHLRSNLTLLLASFVSSSESESFYKGSQAKSPEQCRVFISLALFTATVVAYAYTQTHNSNVFLGFLCSVSENIFVLSELIPYIQTYYCSCFAKNRIENKHNKH